MNTSSFDTPDPLRAAELGSLTREKFEELEDKAKSDPVFEIFNSIPKAPPKIAFPTESLDVAGGGASSGEAAVNEMLTQYHNQGIGTLFEDHYGQAHEEWSELKNLFSTPPTRDELFQLACLKATITEAKEQLTPLLGRLEDLISQFQQIPDRTSDQNERLTRLCDIRDDFFNNLEAYTILLDEIEERAPDVLPEEAQAQFDAMTPEARETERVRLVAARPPIQRGFFASMLNKVAYFVNPSKWSDATREKVARLSALLFLPWPTLTTQQFGFFEPSLNQGDPRVHTHAITSFSKRELGDLSVIGARTAQRSTWVSAHTVDYAALYQPQQDAFLTAPETLTYPRDYTIEEHFREDSLEGVVEHMSNTGDVHHTFYRRGKPFCGEGQATYPNLSLFTEIFLPYPGTYQGPFQDGLPEGLGKLTLSSGQASLTGVFKKGILNGIARLQIFSSIKYFLLDHGKRLHGIGSWTYPDGIVYEGPFEKGLPHGPKGKLIGLDGSVYEVSFRFGELVGEVRLISPPAKTSENTGAQSFLSKVTSSVESYLNPFINAFRPPERTLNWTTPLKVDAAVNLIYEFISCPENCPSVLGPNKIKAIAQALSPINTQFSEEEVVTVASQIEDFVHGEICPNPFDDKLGVTPITLFYTLLRVRMLSEEADVHHAYSVDILSLQDLARLSRLLEGNSVSRSALQIQSACEPHLHWQQIKQFHTATSNLIKDSDLSLRELKESYHSRLSQLKNGEYFLVRSGFIGHGVQVVFENIQGTVYCSVYNTGSGITTHPSYSFFSDFILPLRLGGFSSYKASEIIDQFVDLNSKEDNDYLKKMETMNSLYGIKEDDYYKRTGRGKQDANYPIQRVGTCAHESLMAVALDRCGYESYSMIRSSENVQSAKRIERLQRALRFYNPVVTDKSVRDIPSFLAARDEDSLSVGSVAANQLALLTRQRKASLNRKTTDDLKKRFRPLDTEMGWMESLLVDEMLRLRIVTVGSPALFLFISKKVLFILLDRVQIQPPKIFFE